MKYVLLTAALLGATARLCAGPAGQPGLEVQSSPADAKDVLIEQNLDAQVPLDLSFRDEAGQTVRLGDLAGDKPVVLVLAYYRCPKLCNLVLNGLLQTFREMSFTVGKEFNVVTVSFDPRETPAVAAAKKETYLDKYGRPGAETGWHFLTGDKPQIDALAQAVGFHYRYVEKDDLYAHASGIMVLTPRGRVSRYFYGIHYSPRDLRLGLVEASENKIGSPADTLLLLCLHYDARTGTYTTVMGWVRGASALTLAALAGFFVWSWRRNRRRATPPARRASEGLPSLARRAGEEGR